MKHGTRALMLVIVSATTLWASAVVAAADAYPPAPPPTSAAGQIVAPVAQEAGASGAALPNTGSDLKLVWIGLVLFVVGFVLVVATRRRAALRHRGTITEAVG
jgi:LPXTG-motif cell wall-anchored protein